MNNVEFTEEFENETKQIKTEETTDMDIQLVGLHDFTYVKEETSVVDQDCKTQICKDLNKRGKATRRKRIDQQGTKKQKSKREYYKYAEEALTLALLDIREGGKAIREASRLYGVPRATLQDRLTGRATHKTKMKGPKKLPCGTPQMPSRRTLKDQQVLNKQKAKRKFFQYSEETLLLALLEIREGRKRVNEASRLYGVPRGTLQDRLQGRAPDKLRKFGPKPIVTIDGEKRITDWVTTLAKRGFPIQKFNLIEAVPQIVKDINNKNITAQAKIFKNGKPGETWYKMFLKRHPEIANLEAESSSKVRAVVTEDGIKLWFFQLQKFLEENNLMAIFDDPDRVLNGDESGFSLCPKTGKVLAPKEWRNLHIKVGNEKENIITVLVVCTASGKLCPPLVVFPYAKPATAQVKSMPESWVLGKSDTGWMKGDVFYEYIKDLNNWLTKNLIKKPVILFIDGHRSQMTISLSEFCEKNGIILYALPPNTNHVLHPVDLSVFRPLKEKWKDTVKNWKSKSENTKKSVTKANFCRVFEEALAVSDMTSAIKNGFQKCGLFPLHSNSIDYTKCVRSTSEGQSNQTVNSIFQECRWTKKILNMIRPKLQSHGINVDLIINEVKYLENNANDVQIHVEKEEGTVDNLGPIPQVNSINSMDNVATLPVFEGHTDSNLEPQTIFIEQSHSQPESKMVEDLSP